MKKYTYIQLYILAIKNSYSYMKGQRNLEFWIKLPFKAHWIAYKSIKD